MDIRGLFIKKKRIEKEMSLEALAHGICSISYLSKIENNIIIANDEIYHKLFTKLKIMNYDDNQYDSNKKLIDEFFDLFLSSNLECIDIANKLVNKEQEFKNSSLFLYYNIFKLFAKNLVNIEMNIKLSEYIPFMNEREKMLFELYNGLYNNQLLASFNNSESKVLFIKSQGNKYYHDKKYISAYNKYLEAYNVASQNGEIIAMCDLSIDLANICSYFDYDEMEKAYMRSINLLQNNIDVKCMSYYNMGSIYLTDKSKWKNAYGYLDKGYKLCKENSLNYNFEKNLFIYFCLIEDEENKKVFYEKIKHNEMSDLYSIMNDHLKYDLDNNYSELILNYYSKDKNNRLLKYLFERNCIINRKYKRAFNDLIKFKY